MTTGQKIKYYRKGKGYTQSELAEIIGVTTQAVSKWETDIGMPDIAQIVPLCKALDVSSDKILGVGLDEELSEVMELRDKIGKHTISFSYNEAERIYSLAVPMFEKYPTNAEVAFWCLESLSVLIAHEMTDKDKLQLIRECTRYERCIERYETNSDKLFKTYFVLSRCYNFLGEKDRSVTIKEKIPFVFGDRTYWEAEFAYADGDMETALIKCKKSFAEKARYISRCIRLARMIGEDSIEKQIKLNEYMLRIINAFLSGGDFLPYRMMYQKISLLSMLVCQYTDVKNKDKAFEYLNSLKYCIDEFVSFSNNRESKHCLMFDENDTDGINHLSKEEIGKYYSIALEAYNSINI